MFCNFQQAQMEAPRGMIQPGSIQREVAFQNGGCARAKLTRHVVGLEIVTLIWMTIEGGVALFAAWTAHSLVLAAFGCDSFVELLSAALVLLQFVPAVALDRVTAARLAGILLFVLALAVTLGSLAALKWKVHPDTSWGGIAITTAALVMMPVLAWAKRRAARARGDKALAADAAQSATCAYLAAVTLCGLAVRAFVHVDWIDPVAALVAVPLICLEGKRALAGDVCGCA